VANANTTALASALSKAMAGIHQRGWCDGTGGNFSCVLEREPLKLLMAPSGVDKGSVAPRDLIEVDGAAQVIAGRGNASAETALHLVIVHTCSAGAVLHTHSQAGTLLSQWAMERDGLTDTVEHTTLELKDLEMLKGLDGIKTHACSVHIPVLANDQDLPALAQRARPLLPGAPHGVLIAGHGLYAWGRNLGSALRHLEILEFLLEQRWRRLLLDALMHSPKSV
jgi:methylthioribulose-1-phosphate dehydratase